ncbi:hypothetical protein F8M41_007189 [Gigaspora margarita]|uniref:Uncharacterized protein n=1 Tax=Gigaspora margarita TaxID=4874 RepID=A0A8H3X8D2_GIGMA|nr:hypothetical protein F8M41_007189 [Gigaspora margarita]
MSTNPMPKNVLCFKNLALNILKNSSQEVITKGVKASKLDPYSKGKEKLFLYKFKKLFTILICGHIYYCSCLEDHVKDLSQCPEYTIEIESIDYTIILVLLNLAHRIKYRVSQTQCKFWRK